jgi:hypothetical protein
MFKRGEILPCVKWVSDDDMIPDKLSKFDTMPFASYRNEDDGNVDFYDIIKKSIISYNKDIKLLEKDIETLQTKIDELVQYDNIDEEISQVKQKIVEVNTSMTSTSISDIPNFIAFKKSLDERLATLFSVKKSKNKQELVQELERKMKLLNNANKKKEAIQKFDIDLET